VPHTHTRTLSACTSTHASRRRDKLRRRHATGSGTRQQQRWTTWKKDLISVSTFGTRRRRLGQYGWTDPLLGSSSNNNMAAVSQSIAVPVCREFFHLFSSNTVSSLSRRTPRLRSCRPEIRRIALQSKGCCRGHCDTYASLGTQVWRSCVALSGWPQIPNAASDGGYDKSPSTTTHQSAARSSVSHCVHRGEALVKP
jgi:hypothetical protein